MIRVETMFFLLFFLRMNTTATPMRAPTTMMPATAPIIAPTGLDDEEVDVEEEEEDEEEPPPPPLPLAAAAPPGVAAAASTGGSGVEDAAAFVDAAAAAEAGDAIADEEGEAVRAAVLEGVGAREAVLEGVGVTGVALVMMVAAHDPPRATGFPDAGPETSPHELVDEHHPQLALRVVHAACDEARLPNESRAQTS